ncbi:MAG: hypothetical protein Q8J97_08195 [Flavobacteriaceae bacterium]|nr:hypothetical protein [Flavobacteriaceae bacterium]
MDYKRRSAAAIIVFVSALLLANRYAFQNTVEVKRKYVTLKDQAESFKQAASKLALLERENKYYDSIFQTLDFYGGTLQDEILKTIGEVAKSNELELLEFKTPHVINTNNIERQTFFFTLEGLYNNILRLVHHLEQKKRFGEIIHIQIQIAKRSSKSNVKLQAYIAIQHSR